MRELTNIWLVCLISAFAGILTACEENLYEEDTYANWPERNAQAFSAKLGEAKAAIAAAKAAHGDDWEAHCDWRVYRTYAMTEDAQATAADSVCVQIVERGTGSGCPLYTDSVRVNYLGRIISTDVTVAPGTPGDVFDHSGLTQDYASVFSPDFSRPSMFRVSNTVEGFTTALMRMHIGDLWRVYIPQQLGYGGNAVAGLPAYSTLIFDIQLKAYYRAGTIPGAWN